MKWWLLLGCALSFSVVHANRIMMHVILPLATAEFQLSYRAAAVLGASYDIGYFLTLLPIGYVALWYGNRRAIISGLAVIVITSLATGLFARSFYTLLAYRLVAGLGFSFYYAAGHATIASYFPPRERGRALGFHAMGSAAGRIYGAALMGLIAGAISWRFSFVAFAGLVALILILVKTIFSRVPEEREGKGKISGLSLFYFFKQRAFLVTSLIHSFAFTFFMVSMTFYALYLTKVNGLSIKTASFLVALVSVAAIPANPWVGGLSDRYGRRKIAVIAFSGAAALSFILPLVQGLTFLVIFSLALGLVISSPMAVIMGYLTELAPTYSTSAAVGAYNTFGGGMTFLFTFAFGNLADLAGLKAVYIGLGLLMAMAAYLAGNMLKAKVISA